MNPISTSLFLSVDEPVQKIIFMHLPAETLEKVALVCKRWSQFSQEAVCSQALPHLEHLTFSDGCGFHSGQYAASVLLSNCKTIAPEQKVEIIKYRNVTKQFSDLAALIPFYPPAENLAEKVTLNVCRYHSLYYDYFKLFKITGNKEYLFKAFPKPMSSTKDLDLWVRTYCETSTETFAPLYLLLKYAKISSNPKRILEKARLINVTSTLDSTDKFEISLKIYLVYLKLCPAVQEDDFTSTVHKDLCKYYYGDPSNDTALHKAITKIVLKNVPLARSFAAKIDSSCIAIDAHLAIANFTKDPADLRQIKLLKPKGIQKKYQNAIAAAIDTMKDISLVRELAEHLMTGWKEDYHAFKAYLQIYAGFHKAEDIDLAEKIAQKLVYAPKKMKAFRMMYEQTKDQRYYQLGVNLFDHMAPAEKSHALAEVAVLTNNVQFLDNACEIKENPLPIQTKICNICIRHFKDLRRARDYINNKTGKPTELLSMLATASREPDDIQSALESIPLEYYMLRTDLLVIILSNLILETKFEQAVEFEREWLKPQ